MGVDIIQSRNSCLAAAIRTSMPDANETQRKDGGEEKKTNLSFHCHHFCQTKKAPAAAAPETQ